MGNESISIMSIINKMDKRGITLVELMIVIIIIGVTATLGVVHFNAIKESSLDREVNATLKQVSAAQRIYHLKENSYYASDTVGQTEGTDDQKHIKNINDHLKLYLPYGDSRSWNYYTYDNGCVQSVRNAGDRTWYLNINDADGEPDATDCTPS